MSIGSIAVSGIGYGALAVALSGFVSSGGGAAVLVGAGLEQATELGTASLPLPYTGEGLVQETSLGTGYITQIGPIPEAGPPGTTSTVIKKPGIPA